jgi:hypothetical protein
MNLEVKMTKLVIVSFNLYCAWSEKAPTYRLYVNNELQTEREYKFNNNEVYLKERLPLFLEPGEYTIVVENVSHSGVFTSDNLNIELGEAEVISKLTFKVL